MDSFNIESSPPRLYSHNYDATGSGKINTLIVKCDFLDALRTNANLLNVGAASKLQYLHPVPIPALGPGRPMGNTLEPPVNASMIGSPSNGQDKGCQSQWQFLWWFVWKIEDYCEKLQGCRNQIAPADLSDWLAGPNRSREIRSVGLRALGDISNGNTLDQLHEILAAMIVQHTISHYTCQTNSFEGGESAFCGWRNAIPLIEPYQRSFDVVFERLRSVDRSSLGDAQPARPHYQTSVFETGGRFPNSDLSYYPPSISDDSLYHNSTRGHPDSSQSTNPWGLPQEPGFASRPDNDYSATYPLDQPPALGPYDPLRGAVSPYSHATNMNGPFPSNDVGAYSAFPQQTHLRDLTQSYGLSSSSNYTDRGTQMTSLTLNHTTPFNVFMKFIDDFTNQGGLPHLFSHRSIHRSKPSPNANARVSETLFFAKAENSFFDPLRKTIASQPSQTIVAQAIISATRSLALHGGLRSYSDVAEYIINLSKALLPTHESYRDFIRSVVQTYSKVTTADERRKFVGGRGQDLGKREEEILKAYRGEYYPVCLLGTPGTARRTLPPRHSTRPSRTSNSRPPPSIAYSSGSTGLNFPDNNTEISVAASEPYFHSQSSLDPHAYPVNPRTTNTTPSITSTAQCTECGKVFNGRNVSSHLSRHKRAHQEADKTIVCPSAGCGKVFKGSRTDNIRAHCWNVHKEKLPEDGKAFWSSRAHQPEI